jgi:DNA mismatch endonuclease, patch repair protein
MSKIRSRNTGPELALRRALRRDRVRYRSYQMVGGVTVDIALPDRRLVVFVHGCFWHGCRQHYVSPIGNSKFWARKLLENKRRDSRQIRRIHALGWRTMIVWEHSLGREEDSARVVRRIVVTPKKSQRGRLPPGGRVRPGRIQHRSPP